MFVRSVPARPAGAKRSTVSTSPLTPGTSKPCSRSAVASALGALGTTESRRSYGGVRLTAPRTSPSSSSQPKASARPRSGGRRVACRSRSGRPSGARVRGQQRQDALRRMARRRSLNFQGTPRRLRIPQSRHRCRGAARPRAPRRAPTACARCCRARASRAAAPSARRGPPGARPPAAAICEPGDRGAPTPRGAGGPEHRAEANSGFARRQGFRAPPGARRPRRAPRGARRGRRRGRRRVGKRHPLGDGAELRVALAHDQRDRHRQLAQPVPQRRHHAGAEPAQLGGVLGGAAAQPVGVGGGGDLGRLAREQRLRRPLARERLDADRLDAVRQRLVGGAARRALAASASPGLAEISTSRSTRSGIRSASASASRPPIE